MEAPTFNVREALDGAGGVDVGSPENLVGQKVPDSGHDVLVEEPSLYRCSTVAQSRPELGGGDRGGVGAELVEWRVEPDAAKPARIDQPEQGTVSEIQPEPGVAEVTGRPPELPVVAAVDLGAIGSGNHDLAGHAEMDAEPGPGRGVAPHRLSPSVRSSQFAPDKSSGDLTGCVGTAHVAVGVVDGYDPLPEGCSFDNAAGRLNFG